MISPFFEVHYWSSEGRIMVINETGFGSGPSVAFLAVVETTRNTFRRETTMVTALALANAGDGDVIEHDADGTMRQLHTQSLNTIAILRKADKS